MRNHHHLKKRPSAMLSLMPIAVLVAMLTCTIRAFGSDSLGVATFTYLPFCFFNIISPLMSVVVAASGWHIPAPRRMEEDSNTSKNTFQST